MNVDLQRLGACLNKNSLKTWFESVKWEKPEILTFDVDVQAETELDIHDRVITEEYRVTGTQTYSKDFEDTLQVQKINAGLKEMPPKKRKQWNAEAMKRAVEAVKNKELGTLKASKAFGVPKSTLIDYVISKKPVTLLAIKLGRKPTLTNELEEALVEYALEMERRYFGLRASDVRRLAFQLAIRNGLKHPFSCRSAAAGKKWLKSFMSRHPKLSLRKPQGISAARVEGFTKENVQAFFNLLGSVLPKVGFNPAAIYNVDETSITVQHKHAKVISLKGKRQVAALTASERGALVTIVTCMNAVGRYIPPMLVFPRKNMKPELLNGAPPGSVARFHPSGWIQQDIFTDWLRHFILHVKPSESEQVVLILDGHYSHSRNIDVINIARDNFVHIICLPPHSTNKLQPLDVSFMSPFKTYYPAEIETWLRANPGRVVTSYQISELMGRAYLRAASCEIAVNGFRKCGIFPFQPTIFRDDEFAIHSSNERQSVEGDNDGNQIAVDPAVAENLRKERETTPPISTPKLVVPQDICPIPSLKTKHQSPKPGCSGEASKKGGKRGSTAILTSTPYNTDLEESLKKRKKITPKKVSLNQNKSKLKNEKEKVNNKKSIPKGKKEERGR
ncbi:unnamed protein product [Acanthoscelides obtectus]|uniref:HTH CENPB-type domain-containing protein n=1 Tax=Acanthoscelides obtectus TaxID=200917 RepID=A0A9P0PAN5_ACAOB|nr:unnamed protein product [Acanthoscelides obtectus]CAK1640967.1 Pogo transposable element with KRAB domain [Acanthoscelides obtectus]